MKATFLELFVRTYLATHRNLSVQSMQKAEALINNRLNPICCEDSSDTLDLITIKKDNFINTVEQILRGMPKQGNIASMNRTIKLLQQRLHEGDFAACCT